MATTVQARFGYNPPMPGADLAEGLQIDVDTNAAGEGSFADIPLEEDFEGTPQILATARTEADEASVSADVSEGSSSSIGLTGITTKTRKMAPSDLDIEVTGHGGSLLDFGYSVDKLWHDGDKWLVQITETEGLTSIQMNIRVSVEPDVTVQNVTQTDFDLEVQNGPASGTVTVEVLAIGPRIPS